MEHQLGRIDIVAWQGGRLRHSRRPGALAVVLGLAVLISAALLLARFLLGAPLPLELLQLAFAIFVASGALLLMRVLVSLVLRLQKP